MTTLIRETCYWLAASVLALMPIALAIDFGGVLWWSQYVAALATSGVVVLTAIGYTISRERGQLAQQVLLVPLLLWAAMAWFQTVPLSPTVVGWLSPASAAAYTSWIAPFATAGDLPTRFPISVSVTDSRHALAVLCIVVAIAWSSAIVFNSRLRLGMLLSVLAVGAAMISGVGLWLRLFPDVGFLGYEDSLSSSSFATIINRNNAALLLNVGLACSLGLISWRLTALTGQEVDDPNFDSFDLLSLTNDRESMLGIVSAALCISGLLVGGSRGGVVSALIGMLLAFGWVRQRRGLVSFPVIAVVIGLCVAILLVPADLSLESIQRLEVLANQDSKTLLNDGRLTHWPDGFRAAVAHFPSGSGLATYGDAVRPHQQTSESSGFDHADNLWVELVTEQSVMGVLLAIAILVLVIRSLQRMGESADPIDQGLRIAGWFAIGALVTSQAFDFGLILPANLFAFALLLPAVIARDVSAGTANTNDIGNASRREQTTSASRGLFANRNQTRMAIVTGVLPILALFAALPRLRADAKTEVLQRGLKSELKMIQTNDAALSTWIEQISEHALHDPSPRLFESLCELTFLRARLHDVAEQTPNDAAEAIELYSQTDPSRRRLQWDRTSPQLAGSSQADSDLDTSDLDTSDLDTSDLDASDLDTSDLDTSDLNTSDLDNTAVTEDRKPALTSDSLYRQSLDFATRAILLRPLSQTPRPYQVYLDFVHRDPKRTRAALEQLMSLYSKEPGTLLKLGSLAADGGDEETAIQLWRSAITLHPSLTTAVLASATQHDLADLAAIIPESKFNYRLAASFLVAGNLLESDENQELLRRCLEGMDCGNCETPSERAECEQLAGDIAYVLQQFDESFVRYEEALRFDPYNASLRLKLITRLNEQGQRQRALDEARKARLMIKQDPRFDQVINEMNAEDRQTLEKPQTANER